MNRTVLITGGAKRLGAAMARGLAAAGYRLVIHTHNSEPEAASLAAELGNATIITGDLAENPVAIIQAAITQAGPLYGLINNAARFTFDRPANVTAADIAAHMAPNLVAPVLLAQAFATQNIETGVIINILDHKLQNLNPDFFAYTLSKAALAAAGEMMAMAFAPRIRVCGIAPGLTLPGPKQDAEKFARAWRANPLGQGPTPTDIARAALFILDTPSLTGTTITVDSGEHLLHRMRDIAFLAPQ